MLYVYRRVAPFFLSFLLSEEPRSSSLMLLSLLVPLVVLVPHPKAIFEIIFFFFFPIQQPRGLLLTALLYRHSYITNGTAVEDVLRART